jgi:hypothetical protein
MPAYSLAVLLSAISFYLASILILRLSSEPQFRWRSSVLLVLLGGFLLSTFCRAIATSQHEAELSILLIYAHAVFIPTLFFDFALYCFRLKLRRALLPAGYASSTPLLWVLSKGSLISGVGLHRYLFCDGGLGWRFDLLSEYRIGTTVSLTIPQENVG